MVKTKSIKDPVELSDGKRILVMRRWPQGYSKAKLRLAEPNGRLPSLGPSTELLKDWHTMKKWDQYITRYIEEMEGQRNAITELAVMAKTETVTLLCIEDEDDPHCHRHLLKRLIEEAMLNL